MALPRAVRMEPELDGEPELLTEIPAKQNSDSPKTSPRELPGLGIPGAERSLCVGKQPRWGNPHICSAPSEALGCSG